MHTKTQCKGKCVLHKEHDVEKMLHKHFLFQNTNEFIIFMLWGLFVTAFLLTIAK